MDLTLKIDGETFAADVFAYEPSGLAEALESLAAEAVSVANSLRGVA
jgi:hypothetical protein